MNEPSFLTFLKELPLANLEWRNMRSNEDHMYRSTSTTWQPAETHVELVEDITDPPTFITYTAIAREFGIRAHQIVGGDHDTDGWIISPRGNY